MQDFINIYFPLLLIIPSLLDKYLTKYKLVRYLFLILHTIVFIVLVSMLWIINKEAADPNKYVNLIASLAFFSYPFFYIFALNSVNVVFVYMSEFILVKVLAPILLISSIIINLFFSSYSSKLEKIMFVFYYSTSLMILFCLGVTIFVLALSATSKNKEAKDALKVDLEEVKFSNRDKIYVVIYLFLIPVLISLIFYFFAKPISNY